MSERWDQSPNSKPDDEGKDDSDKRQFSEWVAVLSDPCCHTVISYLATCPDEPATVEELARSLAGSKMGYHPSTLIKTEYDEIQTALQRTQLPRLHGLNLISFNPRQEEVYPQQPSWVFLLLDLVGKFLNWIR